MIKLCVTPQETVDFLNELVNIDKPAIAALIANRVSCNDALADHESVQVLSQQGDVYVGMLGILNGLFGVDENGRGVIAAVFGNGLAQSKNLTGFVLLSPERR